MWCVFLYANNFDIKPFCDFIGKFDLVNKYCNKYPWEVVWTCTNGGSLTLVVHSSYINWVLVNRISIGLLDSPCFYSIVNTDHRLIGLCKLISLRLGY